MRKLRPIFIQPPKIPQPNGISDDQCPQWFVILHPGEPTLEDRDAFAAFPPAFENGIHISQ